MSETRPPISITWTRSEDDYLRALMLNYRNLKAPRILLRVLTPATAALLVLYWFVFGPDLIVKTYALIFGALVVSIALGRFIVLPSYGRKVFRQQKALHQPLTQEIDETGLRESRSEHNHSLLLWEDVHRSIEGPREFLIYQSEALFHMIPKAELSAEEIDRVRDILALRVR